MIPQRLLSALRTGNVVLFLGAGANYNCKMTNGEPMPIGDKLSELISQHFHVRKGNLAETAELAEYSSTRSNLNTFIIELFSGAKPSDGFSLIRTFKWKSIYTTNYDLLIEDIYNLHNCVQKLKVYYTSHQNMDLGPNDVPYYKLHGCVSKADTEEGRLIITPDDYAEYRKKRNRIYYRMSDDLGSRPFLYIGYGRQDVDFRDIMADVHSEMNGDIPEGYALFPGKKEEDDILWNRKGITLIDLDVDQFLNEIDEQLKDRDYNQDKKYDFPIPEQYEPIDYLTFNESLTYFQLPVPKYGANVNANAFYNGSEAKWIDLQNFVEAERDIYNEVMDNLFDDAVSIDNETTSYGILSEAGTGKSTLLKRLAYDLCKDFNQIVFWYNGERRLNFSIIESIYQRKQKRIFIFVDRGSKYSGNLESVRRSCTLVKIPVTIVIADRINEWNLVSAFNFHFTQKWIIGRLSDNEIEKVVNKLDEFNCNGELKHLTIEQRIEVFKNYSNRQLLIALIQATHGGDFKELIIEEYLSIPDEIARRAYLYICTMHSFGKGIRITTLARCLGIKLSEVSEYFKYLEGLIDYNDDLYMSRHAIISEIIFFAEPEEARINILEQLIKKLDLGYISDYHIYKSLTNNIDLIIRLGGIETRRRVYEALKEIKREDAFIEHHEAIMEIRSHRDGGSLERAESLLKDALKKTANAISIKHTVGLLYIEKSKQATGLEKRMLLAQAIQEFMELIKREKTNDYAWVSLIESRIDLGNLSTEYNDKLIEYMRAEEDYQKAIEYCGAIPYLYKAKGKIEAALGHGNQAREFFKKAIAEVAPPVNLFANYIKWELRHKSIPDALEASKKALELYEDNVQIVILRAKSIILGSNFDISDVAKLFTDILKVVNGYYKMEAHFWYGIALWETGFYKDAMEQFEFAKSTAFSLGRTDIKLVRYISGINTGNAKSYLGNIIKDGPRQTSIICNPSGIRIYISPNSVKNLSGEVTIKIGFNRLGPVAILEMIEEEFVFDNIV